MSDHAYSNDGGHGSSMMTGFVVGALVGAGLALLLAPASGEDTRRRLGETARRFRDEAKDRMGSAREKLSEARDTISEKVSSLTDDARSAYETGREAFSQARGRRTETDSGAARTT